MMEAMREHWTDARLDDLNHRVDAGFSEVSREFQTLRLEVRTEFVAIRGEIGSVRGEIGSVRDQVASESQAIRSELAENQRTLIQIGAGLWMTSLVGFLGVIVTVVTQA